MNQGQKKGQDIALNNISLFTDWRQYNALVGEKES
jgi:hypothetical protein